MKIHKILLLAALTFGQFVISQDLYFPPTDSDEWDTLSPESLGWCTDQIPALYDYLEENNTKGFLVLKDGKMVIEKYFDDFDADSFWYWASAGKTITALLTGIAQEEGYLSLDDPTSSYLGEGWTSMPTELEAEITVWNQLTMTSGLDDEVDDIFCTDPECLIYKAPTGTRWAYHNGPYTLLDGVISEATGTTLNMYCNSRLEAQTGMSGLFVPSGYNNVYFSKPRDLARFGLLIQNNANWDGTPVLSDMEYFNAMINTSQSINKSYGYLWWLNGKESYMIPGSQTVFTGSAMPNAPDDMIAALGKNGQIINVVPSLDMVVVRIGNIPSGFEALVPTLLNNTIWDYLNAILCEASGIAENEIAPHFQYRSESKQLLMLEKVEQLQVFNLSGAVVYSENGLFDSETIDLSFLPSGLHIITGTSENGTTRQKIIIP